MSKVIKVTADNVISVVDIPEEDVKNHDIFFPFLGKLIGDGRVWGKIKCRNLWKTTCRLQLKRNYRNIEITEERYR